MNGYSGEIGFQVARDRIKQMQDDAGSERMAATAARSTATRVASIAARRVRTGFGWLRVLGLAH